MLWQQFCKDPKSFCRQTRSDLSGKDAETPNETKTIPDEPIGTLLFGKRGAYSRTSPQMSCSFRSDEEESDKQFLRARGEPATRFGETAQDRHERRCFHETLTSISHIKNSTPLRESVETGTKSSMPWESDREYSSHRSVRLTMYCCMSIEEHQKHLEAHPCPCVECGASQSSTTATKVALRATQYALHGLLLILKEWVDRKVMRRAPQEREIASLNTTWVDLLPLLHILCDEDVRSENEGQRSVEPEAQELVTHVYDILLYVWVHRNYVAAMQRYFHFSIGNAPWPMGIPISGLDSTVSRERISKHKIQHKMNDPTVCRYVRAIRRLVMVAQELHPATSTSYAI